MKTLDVLQPICCGSDAPSLSREEADRLALTFKALSDPTRVAIVNRLSGAEVLCVCDLTAAFELSQPTISHHLKILRDAGLVEARAARAERGEQSGEPAALAAARPRRCLRSMYSSATACRRPQAPRRLEGVAIGAGREQVVSLRLERLQVPRPDQRGSLDLRELESERLRAARRLPPSPLRPRVVSRSRV